jgi:hypothetical protein
MTAKAFVVTVKNNLVLARLVDTNAVVGEGVGGVDW